MRAAASAVSKMYSLAGRLVGVIILCPYGLSITKVACKSALLDGAGSVSGLLLFLLQRLIAQDIRSEWQT